MRTVSLLVALVALVETLAFASPKSEVSDELSAQQQSLAKEVGLKVSFDLKWSSAPDDFRARRASITIRQIANALTQLARELPDKSVLAKDVQRVVLVENTKLAPLEMTLACKAGVLEINVSFAQGVHESSDAPLSERIKKVLPSASAIERAETEQKGARAGAELEQHLRRALLLDIKVTVHAPRGATRVIEALKLALDQIANTPAGRAALKTQVSSLVLGAHADTGPAIKIALKSGLLDLSLPQSTYAAESPPSGLREEIVSVLGIKL